MPTIIFDTETTGLPNAEGSPLDSQPKIIEFAAVKMDEELVNELERISFFVNPMCQLSDIITRITGLTNRDLDDQPTFSFHYDKLCSFFLGCNTVIAHNLTFDLSLLKFELQRLSKQWAFPYPYKHICTIEKTMHVKGYRLNLGKLHQHFTGEEYVNGAHRAMNDVEALVRCCKKMREQNVI